MIGWGCALSFAFLTSLLAGVTWLGMNDINSPLSWLVMPITIIVFILVSWALAPRQQKIRK